MRFNIKKTLLLGAGLAMLAGPAFAAQWISGHYGPGGDWHPGHWVGGYGPPPGPNEGPPGPAAYGHHWLPGHYGPGGDWHPGHWVAN